MSEREEEEMRERRGGDTCHTHTHTPHVKHTRTPHATCTNTCTHTYLIPLEGRGYRELR